MSYMSAPVSATTRQSSRSWLAPREGDGDRIRRRARRPRCGEFGAGVAWPSAARRWHRGRGRSPGVAIFPGEGGRDEASEQALAAALEKGGTERVTRLYRRDDVPEDQCRLRAPGWCLAYR